MEQTPIVEAEYQQEQDLSRFLRIDRANWMASRLTYDDQDLMRVMSEVIAKLPESASLEDVARAVTTWENEELARINPDLAKAEEIIGENRKPLTKEFVDNRTPPLLGEYFDSEKPAHVCQHNVLLLSAVAAAVGLKAEVAPFTYTGSQTGLEWIHAVALGTDAEGQVVIMDPTLRVPKYGDVSYLPKEEYLSRFINPNLYNSVSVFSPLVPRTNQAGVESSLNQ